MSSETLVVNLDARSPRLVKVVGWDVSVPSASTLCNKVLSHRNVCSELITQTGFPWLGDPRNMIPENESYSVS